MANKRKWYEYPLRIIEIGNVTLEMREKTYGKEAPWVKEAETKAETFFGNVEHLNVQEYDGGSDDRGFLYKTKVSKKENVDYLGKYLPEAKKKGLKTFIYFNVHHVKADFGKEHPKWIQYDSKGKAITIGYGSGNVFCVNSPWREWSFQVMRDLGQYKIDGIFLDGPYISHKGCYCPYCKKLFEERYNSKIPDGKDHTSPLWRNFIDFRYDSIANYLRDAREALRSARPEAIIYMNSNHLLPGWTTARDNRRLVKHQDILAGEGGFIFYVRPIDIPLWKPGATAKLLESQSGGKPRVVFLCGNHKPWDRYLLPKAEIKLLYAETIANGANPWFAIRADQVHLKRVMAGREMNRFIAENSEYYDQTSSKAKAALVWSLPTEDYYGTAVDYTDFSSEQKHQQNIGNPKESFQGYYETLVRSHIPFDVIDDVSLEDGFLERYEAIILPNTACISEEGVKEIKKYVQGGGGLIATLESSLYNKYGEKQKDFQLAEVLGLNYAQGEMGPLPYDYISITDEHPVTKDIENRLFPAPNYGIKTILKTAESLADFHEKLPARYVPLSPLSEYTALAINNYGSGRAVYLGGNFPEHYWTYRIPEHKQIMADAVRWLSTPQIELENAPETLEVIIREQKDKNRIIIHLINFTGEMSRPITHIIPCRDVKLSLSVSEEKKSVRALWLNKNLPFQQSSKKISFSIPLIKEYEVIVIE